MVLAAQVLPPYLPAGQGMGSTEPSGQKLPIGQGLLQSADVNPGVAPKVPDGHGLRRPPVQYVPGPHCSCPDLERRQSARPCMTRKDWTICFEKRKGDTDQGGRRIASVRIHSRAGVDSSSAPAALLLLMGTLAGVPGRHRQTSCYHCTFGGRQARSHFSRPKPPSFPPFNACFVGRGNFRVLYARAISDRPESRGCWPWYDARFPHYGCALGDVLTVLGVLLPCRATEPVL